MKLLFSILALAIAGASAQSATVITAVCGTDCPTAIPDKSITRTKEAPTETSPCPSFIVSTSAGYGNSSSGGSGSGGSGSPSAPAFTGGAAKLGSMGAAIAAGAAILAL